MGQKRAFQSYGGEKECSQGNKSSEETWNMAWTDIQTYEEILTSKAWSTRKQVKEFARHCDLDLLNNYPGDTSPVDKD